MKNIAFSKIGKSIKFHTKYSPSGGDNEASQLLCILANNNPDKTFYIVGRSDFSKMSSTQSSEMFKFGNVIDTYASRPKNAKYTWLNDYFADKKVDVHIAMTGQIGTVTIPGKIKQVRNPELIASVIEMTRGYSTDTISWMNDNQHIPVLNVINDPRYDMSQSRDMIVNPKWSLSQFNYSYIKNSIRSYEDQTRDEHTINVKYAEMEKIFLYGRSEVPINIKDRIVNFMVVLNEGSPSRYPMLNEWILSKVEDVEVYGSWSDERALSDSRFKGSLVIDELQKKLSNVRSTFIIPIAPGWVTSKYIEMIHAGVVPFLHPTYDSSNLTGLPEFLRPKTPEELFKRIEQLKDDSVYMKVISALRHKYLSSCYTDGSKLNKIIMTEIDSAYQAPDLSLYNRVESNSLEELLN